MTSSLASVYNEAGEPQRGETAEIFNHTSKAVIPSQFFPPAYLTSNFTELENILAEHLGLESAQRRLLAVMREDCTPRLGMRARLWLDMRNADEFEPNVARLICELRQPPYTQELRAVVGSRSARSYANNP